MALGNHSIPIDEGPGLYYLGADGTLTLLDQDRDLTRMEPRERAIATALVGYAHTQLRKAEYDALYGAGIILKPPYQETRP